MDVRPHPHINLSTVTYLFEGAIGHRDSLGTAQVIEPGAINLMTAGRGIVHSERTPPDVRAAGSPIYGMQTWLALPDGREDIDPAFEHVASGGLPIIEAPGVNARVLMGSLWGKTAAVSQHAATIYADLQLDAGASIPIDADADERAVLLVEGEASVDGIPLEAFTTPRHVWWNFVSSSRDRINQAKQDWQAGNFPLVPGDEHEFIPIPAVPKTVSYP
jgi:redox-sensitive bicupin YhaK (pirin superfamily)